MTCDPMVVWRSRQPDGVMRPPGKDRMSLVMVPRGDDLAIAHGANVHIDADAEKFDPTMQSNFLASATAAAISAMLGVSTLAAAQTAPPIGGGYTDAIAIPVDDPTTKNISGGLCHGNGSGLRFDG